MNTLEAVRAQTTADAANAGGAKKADSLASKDTFLQLLVAQMRNQDPLQPTDGVQFLAQLAQFSGLEKTIELRDEVTSVRKAVDNLTSTIEKLLNPATGGQNK